MAVFMNYFVFIILFVFNAMGECDILVYTQEPPRLIEEEFRDMPAKFGPVISAEGLRAFVTTGEPRDGCSKLQSPPSEPNFTGNWVVLIARYNCSFEEKVRNAQAAGYNGVIVHNVNSSDLEIMSAKNHNGITIPSVFVSDNTGFIIDYSYRYNNGYFVVINGDLPFNINTHLLLPFAVVVVLCLIIMIIFLVVRCIRERRRARRHRLPNSSLKKIPTCKFAKGDPYDTCAICLDDYVEGDKLRVLPCAHAYHCKCIDPWLTKNRRVCPVCKRKVFASGERPSRRSRDAANRNDTHSDSDTDDDRAPLVDSRTDEGTTQGGTFERQRENPFIRAARSVASGRSDSQRVATNMPDQPDARVTQGASWPESSGGLRGGPFLTGVLNLRGDRFTTPNQYDVESLNDDRHSLIAGTPSTSSRSPRTYCAREKNGKVVSMTFEEFLRFRKRLQKNNRRSPNSNRSQSSDSTTLSTNSERGNLEIDAADNPKMNDEEPSHDDGCDRCDINSYDVENSTVPNEQGRIGVAALPNVQISEIQQSRDRGNDFIV